jgi:hypothetical protein
MGARQSCVTGGGWPANFACLIDGGEKAQYSLIRMKQNRSKAMEPFPDEYACKETRAFVRFFHPMRAIERADDRDFYLVANK